MKILVTGCAGFIGMNASLRLLDAGHEVVGVDNVNDYYDVRLKENRLAELAAKAHFSFERFDLAERARLEELFARHRFDRVLHLAAQAGVRYSLTNPHAYMASNLVAFLNMLECCRHQQVPHLTYASSSSVYGANAKLPFSTSDPVDHPVSLYAATKRANELMAHSYSHLFNLPTTGLRFFTVYGPWGRPDMALFKFTAAILKGEAIDVYGQGKMERDFTYVGDIVEGLVAAIDRPATVNAAWDPQAPDPATSGVAPWRVLNLGNGQRIQLMRYIQVLEEKLGRQAQLNMLPMQPGDVARTQADVQETRAALDYTPSTPVEVGVGRFVDWYLDYYGVKA